MKKVHFLSTIILFVAFFQSCNSNSQSAAAVQDIDQAQLQKMAKDPNTIIIDVRKKSEFDSEHVVNAINLPLNELNIRFYELPQEEPFILHCAGGYRSMIAASILKSRGYHDFVDVEGGMTAIAKTTVPKTNYVCPTTLL